MATSLYAAICGIMLILFSFKIIAFRRKFGIGMGEGNQFEMKRAIRAQANFLEYTPVFLVSLGIAELNGLSPWTINLFGVLFLAGRTMHAYSLLKHEKYNDASQLVSVPKWRIRGMVCTFIVIGSLAITLILQIIRK